MSQPVAPPPAAPSPVRRQARGERRIAQILDAAAAVFAETGYQSATTNAIAGRAGISPGSLYQFFRNKEEIAAALATRYAEQLQLSHTAAFPIALAELPLPELLDRLLDPMIAFNLANPGFQALLADTGLPKHVEAKPPRLHDAMNTRILGLFAARAPGAPAADRERSARVAVQIFKSMLPLIQQATGDDRPAMIAELKTALHRYLKPILG